tara:strand:+ start:35 stop:286 length:252 start_codon:yes stop_codon:yes gene_type:complete
MENYFENVLNKDLNNYIFKIVHKCQLNEVLEELFSKIKYLKELEEAVKDNECNYYITYKRGRFISTLYYPINISGTGWIIYFS